MIFVTVGTTHFDDLIQAVDKLFLVEDPALPVVFQIGSGTYEPSSGEFFRFRPSIDDQIDSASLVISHGGMTVLGLLALRKRFVAVANTALADNHQGVMLRRIASQSSLIWTENPSDVGNCIARAMKQDAAVWTGPSLAHDLNAYIGQLK